MKTVLIIDDHPAYRAGLRTVIENSRYHVIGEAGTAKDGIRLACKLKPDMAVVDLQLPDRHGIPLTKKITDTLKKTYVVIVTAHSEATFALRALQAGAKGYVLKDSEISVILKCLDSVSEGITYLDKSLSFDSDPDREQNDRYHTLSDREQNVMRLIAKDYPAKDIAVELGITLNTVKSHRTSIYKKIGVKNKEELIRYAIRIGLADSDPW